MKKQEQCKQQPCECKAEQKKQYAKPQVTKHGNVESLTQGQSICPSGPILIDRT